MAIAVHSELECAQCEETLVGTVMQTDKHGYKFYVCPVCGMKNYTNEVEFANKVFEQVN